MSRRTLPILLVLLAVTVTGVVWIWTCVTSGPAPRDPILPVPELSSATGGAPSTPSLVPPPSPLPVSPPANAPDNPRVADPSARRESAALPAEDLELRDALWVEGRVIVPPGTPGDEHVEVVANGSPFASRPLHRSPIAADGSFRVAFASGSALGTLDLSAEYLYLEQAITVTPAQPGRDIRLTPRLGGRIHGQVILSPAAFQLRSSIVGSSAEARRRSGEFVHTATIHEDLRFDLTGLPAGSNYEIRILAPGLSPTPLRGVEVERGRTESIVIEPSLAAVVSGLVFDADGAAANMTQVIARSLEVDGHPLPSRRGTDQATSDASGRFAFPELTPGEWELTAIAEGFAESLPYRVRLDAGRSVEGVRLTLRRAGRIAGRVLGIDGQPAVKAGVVIKAEETTRRTPESEGLFSWERWKTTDKHGDFEFDGLSPGRYRLEVSLTDLAKGGDASLSGIALAEGGSVEKLVIRIERPCRIEGRVIGEDGRPVAGVFVSANEAETGLSRSDTAKTDESGGFVLERVPPGVMLLVVHDGRVAQVGETRIALRPGEAARTEIAVRAGTMLAISLEGFGDDRAAVMVTVHDEKGAVVGQWPDGRSWSLGGSPGPILATVGPILPGKYVVEAVAGEKRGSQPVTLSGQELESITLHAGP